ncbi:MAG: class I SAM-dependent methyltransferase [Acidobacteria bacterium ACB2]|nr:class I SAM-dependent methyltransferase [Acidobacteria bacterium ACB2]
MLRAPRFPHLNPPPLDPENEARCRERLREYLTSLGWKDVDQHVASHLSLSEGYEERFSWFDRFVPPDAKDRLLVSGCAVGSEMIVARAHGYREVHGTEVAPHLLAIAETRFAGDPAYRPLFYDGRHLPQPDGFFGAVVSAHVIEHSRAPFRYLAEHVRVLRPGGWLFLEFPHRYHPVELHTSTPSFEWMPWPCRDLTLRLRAARHRREDPGRARSSDAVRIDLRPVSLWQVRLYLRLLLGSRCRVAEVLRPADGIVRLAITIR